MSEKVKKTSSSAACAEKNWHALRHGKLCAENFGKKRVVKRAGAVLVLSVEENSESRYGKSEAAVMGLNGVLAGLCALNTVCFGYGSLESNCTCGGVSRLHLMPGYCTKRSCTFRKTPSVLVSLFAERWPGFLSGFL